MNTLRGVVFVSELDGKKVHISFIAKRAAPHIVKKLMNNEWNRSLVIVSPPGISQFSTITNQMNGYNIAFTYPPYRLMILTKGIDS